MNKKIDESKFTGSGYCTNSEVTCDLQCEKCKFNKVIFKEFDDYLTNDEKAFLKKAIESRGDFKRKKIKPFEKRFPKLSTIKRRKLFKREMLKRLYG